MPVIPLVPSDSPTLISSLLRLSAHHLALAALVSQPLKSGTLSLHLSVPVPVLTPSVVISRPTSASRPSTPLNPSPPAPQIRLCWPLCAFINYIYLLTYLPLVHYIWMSDSQPCIICIMSCGVVWWCRCACAWSLDLWATISYHTASYRTGVEPHKPGVLVCSGSAPVTQEWIRSRRSSDRDSRRFVAPRTANTRSVPTSAEHASTQ